MNTFTTSNPPPDGVDMNAAKPAPPRRVRRAARSRRQPRVFYALGPKGGVGKSTASRALIDLMVTLGRPVRVVQVDRGTLLLDFYPDLARVVHLPGADEMRASPLSAITAFAPLEAALESCLDDGADLVIDVGAAQNAKVFVEFMAKSRWDGYLAGQGIRPIALLLFCAEVSAMAQTADLADILMTIHPGAELVPVLNERDGMFAFRGASQVGRLWNERIAPLLAGRRHIVMPAMAAGAWGAFEGHGLTFRAVVEAEEAALGAQIGEGRAVTATLQGDVSAWLDAVWGALAPLLTEPGEGEAGHAQP